LTEKKDMKSVFDKTTTG